MPCPLVTCGGRCSGPLKRSLGRPPASRSFLLTRIVRRCPSRAQAVFATSRQSTIRCGLSISDTCLEFTNSRFFPRADMGRTRERMRDAGADTICGIASKDAGFWWAHQDLNLEPTDYESAALTVELWARETQSSISTHRRQTSDPGLQPQFQRRRMSEVQGLRSEAAGPEAGRSEAGF